MPCASPFWRTRPGALFGFSLPFPFGEMLPTARDRTVAGAMPVADNEKCVVMERVRNRVLLHVIPQVVVEAPADVAINRLQLDEHQWQPVDETNDGPRGD